MLTQCTLPRTLPKVTASRGKTFLTRMLTCDLFAFAVANVLVLDALVLRSSISVMMMIIIIIIIIIGLQV